jgi:hypothetical protein
MAKDKLLPIGTLPPGIKQAELAELKKVILQSFSVTPDSVSAFGSVTVSWSAVIPASPKFPINITLNGTPVPATGTQQWTLIDTTTFRLAAAITNDPSTSFQLALHEIEVTNAGCNSQVLVLDAVTITTSIKQAFLAAFLGSAQYSLDPSKVSVTHTTGQFVATAPVSISVPDWFDAEMDVTLTVRVSGLENLIISGALTVNVSWSLISDILSLGCTSITGGALTQLATMFLQGMVTGQLVSGIKVAFGAAINAGLVLMQNNDSQQRVFATTAINYTSAGLSITGCPKS